MATSGLDLGVIKPFDPAALIQVQDETIPWFAIAITLLLAAVTFISRANRAQRNSIGALTAIAFLATCLLLGVDRSTEPNQYWLINAENITTATPMYERLVKLGANPDHVMLLDCEATGTECHAGHEGVVLKLVEAWNRVARTGTRAIVHKLDTDTAVDVRAIQYLAAQLHKCDRPFIMGGILSSDWAGLYANGPYQSTNLVFPVEPGSQPFDDVKWGHDVPDDYLVMDIGAGSHGKYYGTDLGIGCLPLVVHGGWNSGASSHSFRFTVRGGGPCMRSLPTFRCEDLPTVGQLKQAVHTQMALLKSKSKNLPGQSHP